MKLGHEFSKGLIEDNPVLRLALGLCPALAVSSSVFNAIGMGIAVIFVLTMSNLIVSVIRKGVPQKIRIPVYIVIIATFVTVVEMVMAAFRPDLFKALGIFVPLIVVNCIILGRAEGFASKHGVLASLLDAWGMGIGFTFALVLIATVREILGNGTWFGIPLTGPGFEPVLLMMLAPGAFITMGFLLALFNWRDEAKAKRLKDRVVKRAGFITRQPIRPEGGK
ncbi:MAG: Electron transport complex subunit RnfE [Calditrichaeota bacterium]|nr:Electron transport complex subunit RnfE [Calditrichota bacterium]